MRTETTKEYTDRVNGYSDEEIKVLIEKDECPYEPERDGEQPIGMYHCPVCGEMVISGIQHPRKERTDEWHE